MKETMRLHLEADGARATLLPRRGGLLSTLSLVEGGKSRELLWIPGAFDSEESGWPGGGVPVMFPFAGRVFLGGQPFRYEMRGQAYDMPLHGFAYGMPWDVESVNARRATLVLESGPQTELLFPFRFTLKAHYTLEKNRIRITLETTATGREPMPVALGLHPYFRMPLSPGDEPDRCRLVTSATERLAVTPSGGAGKAQPFSPPAFGTSLSEPDLANLILGKHTEPWAALVDTRENLAVRVGWQTPDVQYTVLWTRPGEGFHCLEPWMGLPDAVATGAGVRWVEPGSTLAITMEIGLRRA